MRSRARLWILSLATALALAAAAGPEVAMKTQVFRYLFVFDITQSMNARAPDGDGIVRSRLGVAREAVETFLGGAPCGSQAGLAVFSGHRTFLLLDPVEICDNYQELVAILQSIHWRMAWKARSEVAKGLDSALLTTARMDEALRVVFLTDGHEAPPINDQFPPKTKAEPGSVGGIVVGVGGLEPMPIPKLGPRDQLLGYWQHNEVLQVDPYVLGRGAGVLREGMVGVDSGDLEARIARGTEHLSALREAYLKDRAASMALQYTRLTRPEDFAERLGQSKLGAKETAPVRIDWVPALIALLLVVGVYARTLKLRGSAS